VNSQTDDWPRLRRLLGSYNADCEERAIVSRKVALIILYKKRYSGQDDPARTNNGNK
jgi:hypothetical protein